MIEAKILDMYTYSLEDDQVIVSGKMKWSDLESQEYQEFTGEVYFN